MKTAGRILNFYRDIITECIPLFVAAGLLAMLCRSVPVFRDSYLRETSSVLYELLIPVVMGYKAGKKCGGDAGGLAGALAASAVVMTGAVSLMLVAVIIGGITGYLFYRGENCWKEKIPSGFEMLARNLYLAVIGLFGGLVAYYILLPAARQMELFTGRGVTALMQTGLAPWTAILIEPMKVLFLNNWINHGFLLPLGLEQVRESGSSMLFLLETNPGPGFGILAAYGMLRRRERRDLVSSLTIQMFGGIHEIYFPVVLSDLRILAAAVAGGIAGNYCFWISGSGLLGPASPGSILTILMMADVGRWIYLIAGILLSAAVSFCVAWLILRHTRKHKAQCPAVSPDTVSEWERTDNMKICFVCDAGMGSSAMAGALFRRKLKAEGIVGPQVIHVSADRIPEDADLLVCQKSFVSCLPKTGHPCYTVENLTDLSAYDELLKRLKED